MTTKEKTKNPTQNTTSTDGKNGNSNSLNMTNTSTPIIPPTPCPCPENSGSFFCTHLQRRMPPHLATLCKTRPDYRALFERQRDAEPAAPTQKPVHPHWIMCPHRGARVTALPGSVVGAGCKTAEQIVYQCGMFDEPVLRRAAASHRERIAAEIPGYTGRTCRECSVPGTTLPIPTSGLSQDLSRGIITGANEKHWTCLGALAIAAHEQHLGLAVADHGLSPSQRKELERVGVRWIEHSTPELTPSKLEEKISAPLRAWWKPWICEASPFERTAWIDSDTAVTGDLSPLFQDDLFMVSTQFRFSSRTGVYVMLFSHVYPDRDINELPIQIIALNTGVMAFSRGEPLLREWQNETIQLLKDPAALQRCYVRDQSSFIVMLTKRHYTGQQLPVFLPDEYNWPADGLSSQQTSKRRPVSQSPQQFLSEARQRHPGARIVHWLGKVKPHDLQGTPELKARICGIVVCVGLGETLAQTLPRNRRHFDEYIVVTTSDDDLTQSVAKIAKIVISDRCYEPGDSFNKGKLLNAGVTASTCDWILFHDADTVLPPDFRERIQREQLDPDKLYYVSRFNADMDSINWDQPPQDNSINIGPFGYFQLWNRRAKFVAEQNPVSENWPTAATSDIHFKNHWPAQNLVKLPMSVAHLRHGDWTARWSGPKTAVWKFVTQALKGRFLREPALTYPCEVMLQRIDTEERLVYTALDQSIITALKDARFWFDVYTKETG